MKKLIALLILSVFSSTFLIFSFFVFSATSNSVSSRFEKLSPISAKNMPAVNTSKVSVTSDAYTSTPATITSDVYSSTPALVVPPVATFEKEPDKVVYITIDDGPNPLTSHIYLEALKAADVKATFFMIGNQMEKHPDLVKEIAAAGHVIANHSYSHNYSSVYKDVYSLDIEITRTETIINTLAGNQPKIFRAPGGSLNMLKHAGLEEELSKLGYLYFDWNVSAADTDPKGITKENVIYNIETESKGRKKVIVLMHDAGKKASPEALPEVLQWFKDHGYEFGTLNENIRPVHFK